MPMATITTKDMVRTPKFFTQLIESTRKGTISNIPSAF
jgi:hypothetical protein